MDRNRCFWDMDRHMNKITWSGEEYQVQVFLDPPAALSTVTWTLRDDTGAVMLGHNNVVMSNEAEADSVLITVPGVANVKASGVVVGRFLEVAWEATGGLKKRLVHDYRICDWISLSVTPAFVRGLVGLNEAELPDDDLDLVSAVLKLRGAIGNSFPSSEATHQRLVALQALLDIKNSLALRVAATMASDNVSFKRLSSIDMDATIAKLEADFEETLALVDPELAAEQAPPVTTVMTKIGSNPDPITGA